MSSADAELRRHGRAAAVGVDRVGPRIEPAPETAAPVLYPRMIEAARIAFRNSRAARSLSGWRTDIGRDTGAR